MEGNERSPKVPPAIDTQGPVKVLERASGFLGNLIPFPSSQAVGPLSIPSVPVMAGAAQDRGVASQADSAAEAAASIVAQAASVLDEEMARGVLAAQTAPGVARVSHPADAAPVLSQLHELVEQFAGLWPQLQRGQAAAPSSPSFAVTAEEEPLVTLRPPAAVAPGQRATISMTLHNCESSPVTLVPVVTDLLGSEGGRIPASHVQFSPAQMDLAPQARQKLEMAVSVPADIAAGSYSGMLMVKGRDYLRALIVVEVANRSTFGRSEPLPGAVESVSRAVTQDRLPHGSVELAHPAPTALPLSMRTADMLTEAARLAADGELGRSDTIRLLHMPHRAEEVREVLARFEKQLTREARSKLTLELFAPLPEGVDNQRDEPIFDRYPISGRTYMTSSGEVVLDEIQYYNGEMVQLHGECSDVSQARAVLAGSGYKPLLLRSRHGIECAVAQFWAHRLSDTSLRPYDAAFVILAVVPEDMPQEKACLAADENGLSSALAMFHGTLHADEAMYVNHAHLYYVRLLDSTRIAIDVGRERMGTDKRPGTIDVIREGTRRRFSVKEGAGRQVAEIDFRFADGTGVLPGELARAASTAGIALRELPGGTEYVYPCVARIGNEPVVSWQWRSDVVPRLQRAETAKIEFGSSSGEGEMLTRWGFRPKILGYIPNVRGAVTGVPQGR